jgi:hypothetical protein
VPNSSGLIGGLGLTLSHLAHQYAGLSLILISDYLRVLPRKTKRKVAVTSSHSNDESDGPLACYTTEGSAVSDLYKLDNGIPEALRYKPRAGETLVYEEIYIPDVD